MLLDFKNFLLEARLRDVVFISGKDKKDFEFTGKFKDTNLIDMVNIKEFNKDISIKYYNTKDHDISKKIKSRTNLESIGEFNELVKKGLNKLFSDKFAFLTQGENRYELIFPENKIYLIVDINYDNLFEDYSEIFIVTLMSNQAKHNTVKRSITIDDSEFF